MPAKLGLVISDKTVDGNVYRPTVFAESAMKDGAGGIPRASGAID